MAKGRKKGGRHETSSSQVFGTPWNDAGISAFGKDDDDDNDDDDDDYHNLEITSKRRPKLTLEERRARQLCHLCGQRGHIQRLCPGISTGENDDADSPNNKTGRNKGNKNKAKVSKHDINTNYDKGEYYGLEFPLGFSKNEYNEYPNQNHEGEIVLENADKKQNSPFEIYDASCDSMATLEYIQSGRWSKFELSDKAAMAEYRSVLDTATTCLNYGGRISRAVIKANQSGCPPWSPQSASPLKNDDSHVWFLLGFDPNVSSTGNSQNNNIHNKEASLSALLEVWEGNQTAVVGFFCDLDYSPHQSLTSDRDCQIQRLLWTCQAAFQAGLSVQIRLSPSAGTVPSRRRATAAQTNSYTIMYHQVLSDLEEVLERVFPRMSSLKVHVSCWSGAAQDMNRLLGKFPENVWIGMDASVTFAKVLRAHECAFDVPLSRLLLETGLPTTIPSTISKAKGRTAFCHSGLIPFIAQAIAKLKSRGTVLTAVDVARAASENTCNLYPQIVADCA